MLRVTGRADGENYQIGFVDICDTPYSEIVYAARRIGKEMYSLRSNEDWMTATTESTAIPFEAFARFERIPGAGPLLTRGPGQWAVGAGNVFAEP